MSKEDMKKKLNPALTRPLGYILFRYAGGLCSPQDEVLSVEDEAQVDEALAWLNE
ncbi:DNA packaging protein [Escherichia coli]|nr:DNA packaging protein [Escherichia coli]